MLPFILLNLDRPYKMRLTLGGMILWEQLTKTKFAEMNLMEMSEDDFTRLLWILLDTTLDDTARLLKTHGDKIKDIVDAVLKTISNSLSTTEKTEEKEPKFLTFENEFNFAITELGLKPSEFWNLTHAEFMAMHKGYYKRRDEHCNERTIQAYQTAIWSRCDKIPELDSVLIKDEAEKPKQTDEQKAAILKGITAKMGGKIKYIKDDGTEVDPKYVKR